MRMWQGLSLFSGIGGLDLAFEWAGGKVSAMCEIEPYCRKVLHKHWPNVKVFEDVKEMKGADVLTLTGRAVDVIYGGFPCQPFSVAGNKKGKNDSRYLWPEFSRLVGEIRSRWVVAENVLGILHIAVDDVCADLERQGYTVGIWDFEAASVGAKHRRERIFFVAHTDSTRLSGCKQSGEFRAEAERRTAPQPERSGCSHAPDPDKIRCDMRGLEGQGMEWQESSFHQADTSREVIADSSCPRCERVQSGGLSETHTIISGGGRWEPEPCVDRVVNGLPHRVDRLRALGNAVVPQQAYPIFRAIMEADDEQV